jgi:hypothetical protein
MYMPAHAKRQLDHSQLRYTGQPLEQSDAHLCHQVVVQTPDADDLLKHVDPQQHTTPSTHSSVRLVSPAKSPTLKLFNWLLPRSLL